MAAVPSNMSPYRVAWLEFLSHRGETSWHEMPKNKRGYACSNIVWIGLVEAGLIESRYSDGQRLFTITDEGRSALAAYRETTP